MNLMSTSCKFYWSHRLQILSLKICNIYFDISINISIVFIQILGLQYIANLYGKNIKLINS